MKKSNTKYEAQVKIAEIVIARKNRIIWKNLTIGK
jgi:hypothetical protein